MHSRQMPKEKLRSIEISRPARENAIHCHDHSSSADVFFCGHCHSLYLDELGYLPIDKRGADLLFQVISGRYEHGVMVIT